MGSLRSFRFREVLRTLLSTWLGVSPGAAGVVALVVVPGLAVQVIAQQGHRVSLAKSALVSPPEKSQVMVIGFLGGFVRRDDPHHPEVQLIQSLRQQYPSGVFFGLYENGNLEEAYTAILSRLDVSSGKPTVDKNRRGQARILLFGHSWGASAVVRLSRKLDREGIPVTLTVQVDSVAKPFSNDHLIPPNVLAAANFYQTHGFIHGRAMITAADPTRTTVLGNFRRDYNTEPAPCRSFPWYSRLFTKGHIEIECDPDLWLQVKTLLSRYLPDESLAQNQSQALPVEEPAMSGIDEPGSH